MLIQSRKLLLIGQLAAKSGISIKTIRYYEAIGLLRLSRRTKGGFRQFSPESIHHLVLIKYAQNSGFNLEEIREFLKVYDRGKFSYEEIKQKVKNMISIIDSRIEQLRLLQAELSSLLSG